MSLVSILENQALVYYYNASQLSSQGIAIVIVCPRV